MSADLREKYDRLHAATIRQSMVAKSSLASKSSRSLGRHETLLNVGDVDSIDVALAGLDRAEQLRIDGRHPAAMELYEENIGVLIKHLKSKRSGKRDGSSLVDRSVLAERVRVALTDAESLKEAMSLENSKQSLKQPDFESYKSSERGLHNGSPLSKRPNSPSSNIAAAFTSALGIGKSRSYEGHNHMKQPSRSNTINDRYQRSAQHDIGDNANAKNSEKYSAYSTTTNPINPHNKKKTSQPTTVKKENISYQLQ